MAAFQELRTGQKCVAIIGMGYVGVTLAIALDRSGFTVIGFDIDENKISKYASGIDPTDEVGSDSLRNSSIMFTSTASALNKAEFFIVAVPTPVSIDNHPDLQALKDASETLGAYLRRGSIVVFESTVYPGVTEDVCIPILEKASGLTCGDGFGVGYSPERINPGDKNHKLSEIIKIIGACDDKTADCIESVYEKVFSAGLFKVSGIKAAEAIKLAENSQRDVNIAYMNELAVALHEMGIDTSEVLTGMATKWNSLDFSPGLVGGHCISVDPYYFAYAGGLYGYPCDVVSSARAANERMAAFIANEVLKELERNCGTLNGSRVAILGVTYKANCPDIRNSKAFEIARILEQNGCTILMADPRADSSEVFEKHGFKLYKAEEISDMACIVVTVGHDEFLELSTEDILSFFGNGTTKMLFDVTRAYDAGLLSASGITVWQL